MASNPVGPLTQRAPRLVITHLGRECRQLFVAHIGRVRYHDVDRARERVGQRTEPVPVRAPHPYRAGTGDVRRRHLERVLAHVGGPHRCVGQLGLEGQRDRPRPRPQIDHHAPPVVPLNFAH